MLPRHALRPVAGAAVALALASGCQHGFSLNPHNWLGDKKELTDYPIEKPYERAERVRAEAKGLAGAEAAAQAAGVQKLSQQLAGEPDPLIRLEIIRGLAPLSTPGASTVIVNSLGDVDADIRTECCLLLGKRKEPEVVQALGQVLANDTNFDVRLAAAKALGETGSPQAVPLLATTLEDANPAMQHRGMEALKNVSGADLGNDVSQWRMYCQGKVPNPPQRSLASRLFNWF